MSSLDAREVHAIAEDWKATPIDVWAVKDVKTGARLGRVFMSEGAFHLDMGAGSAEPHESLWAALKTASRKMVLN